WVWCQDTSPVHVGLLSGHVPLAHDSQADQLTLCVAMENPHADTAKHSIVAELKELKQKGKMFLAV
ncbi:hypothetical protein NHX12_005762, partial [Muraenolepis orangiensis]